MAMSPKQAVLRGHLLVTLPVFALAIVCGLAARVMLGRSRGAIGALLGFVLGWLWWSLMIPRWRRWAERQTSDPAEVQRVAQQTFLVWKRGSPLEKTEIR